MILFSTILKIKDALTKDEHPPLDNGSVTVVAYENGRFTLETLGDMTYRQVGREIIEKDNGKK